MTLGWSILIGLVTVLSILGMLALLLSNAAGVGRGHEAHVWDDDLREENNPMPLWWLVLFVLTVLFGLAYLQLYPGVGDFAGSLRWSQEAELREGLAKVAQQRSAALRAFSGRDVASLRQDPEALALGKKVFAASCSGCHGQDARGAVHFPDLTDADWLYGGDAQAVETSIAQGRHGAMPAFGATLGASALADLADMITHWHDTGFDPQRRARAMAQYAQSCAACHGPEARGAPAMGAPDLTDAVWLHGGEPAQIASTISGGRSSTMPAHTGLLAAEEIRAVSAYILELGPRR